MRSVSSELAAAIESAERVIRHRVAIDWDDDGYNGDGTIDDLSDRIGAVKSTQQLATQLPEQVRVVPGAAAAQLDVDLARGNTIGSAVSAAYRSGTALGGSTKNISITAPTVQPGDVVVLFLAYANDTQPLPALPKGGNVPWAQLAIRGDMERVGGFLSTSRRVEAVCLIRRAVAGEPAAYTFTADHDITWIGSAVSIRDPGLAGLHDYASKGQGSGEDYSADLTNGPVDILLDGSMLLSFHVGWFNGAAATLSTSDGSTLAFGSTAIAAGNLRGGVQYRQNLPPGRYTQTLTMVPSANMITNYDFETDLTGWHTGSPSVGTITRSNEASHHGAWSLKVVPTGAAAAADGTSTLINVTASTQYTFSAWLMTTVPRDSVGICVDWLTSGDVFISSTLFLGATDGGVWTRVSGSATSPATAAKIRVRVRVAAGTLGNPPASMALYADEVGVRLGSISADVTTAASVAFTLALAPAVAGDDAQHAAWAFSELNPSSPYAGKNRLGRRVTWAVDIATDAGFQQVPVFTGLSLDAGGSARGRNATMRAIDNRELWREPQPLAEFLAEYPSPTVGSTLPLWPGLDTTHIISYLFMYGMQAFSPAAAYRPEGRGPYNGYGFFAAPCFRGDSTMLYAPFHGSAMPFIGSCWYAYTVKQDGRLRRVKFDRGPYVGALEEPAPAGSIAIGLATSSVATLHDVANRQTAGRIEMCVRLNIAGGSTVVSCEETNGAAQYCRLSVLSTRQLRLNLGSPPATIRTVNGPTLPDDGEWHWVGVHWNSQSGSATFNIDGTETVVAFSTWTDSLDVTFTAYNVFVTASAGAQIAELHVDGGVASQFADDPGIGGEGTVQLADPWLHEGFTPSAFIDKSYNELDGVPVVDSSADGWEVAGEIAASELAALYWDADGYPHYRTAYSDATEVGQTVQRTLTAANALKDLDYVSGVTQVRNSITVEYQGMVLHVDEQVSVDGIWRIPAYSQIDIPFTLPGPYINVGAGAVADVPEANTKADGTGTAVLTGTPAFVFATGDTGTITVLNDNPVDIWLVNTSGSSTVELSASWYQPGSKGKVLVENVDSIREFRRQPLGVAADKWRQREESAYQVADRLAADLGVPRATLRNVKIVGDPRLEIGDLVQIVDRNGLGVDDRFRITGLSPSGTVRGGFEQAVTARSATTAAVWGSDSWDDGTVWGA